jgi:hypothetical protein
MLPGSALIGLFRSIVSLEAEIQSLRHQLNVLRRKSPKRLAFRNFDRPVFTGLYGLAPRVANALVIVNPETVIPLASCRLSLVLAMEVPISRWQNMAPSRHLRPSKVSMNGRRT